MSSPALTALAFFTVLLTATTSMAQSENDSKDIAVYDSAILTNVNDVILASEAPGIVKKTHKMPGQDVELDEAIVSLSKQQFQTQLRVTQLTAQIADLEATNDVDLQFARKSIEVNKKLLKRSQRARQAYAKSVTDTDLDRLRLEVEQATLAAKQAELEAKSASFRSELETANADEAQVQLNKRDVRAPFAGRIEQMFVQPGAWVQAGQPIARVVDLKNLRAKGIFDARFVKRIAVGDTATFEYKIDDRVYKSEAQVTFISSVVVDGKFQVWVDIDNSDRNLIPGFKGKLSAKLDQQPEYR